MNFRFLRKKVFTIALIGLILAPIQRAVAVETGILDFTKQQNIEKIVPMETNQEVSFNRDLASKIFVNVEGEYLQIVATPEETGEYAGKIFPNSVVRIIEQTGEWTKIESGMVTGYTKTENIIIGKDAIIKAQEILNAVYPEDSVLHLTEEQMEAAFSVGESKEEEEAKLAAEEAKRVAEEQAKLEAERAKKLEQGKEVVAYAKRFLGNPYVYGGTSLTRGTDCSGFVKGVYAHFGVTLPRTSYEMRKVGYKVSYSEIQPGDIICYRGHVGIYVGNGKIVNAIDESRGIGISNARHRSIVTVRRIF